MLTTKGNARLPGRFNDLVATLAPQAIADDDQLETMIEMIDRLMASGKLTKGQESYMKTLVQLVHVYEAEHHPMDVSAVRGVESLRSIMESSGTNVAELAKLLRVHPTLVYKILRGERSLTVEHIKRLADRFGVRPDLFM